LPRFDCIRFDCIVLIASCFDPLRWALRGIRLICHFQRQFPADTQKRALGDPMDMFLEELKEFLLALSALEVTANTRRVIVMRLAYVRSIAASSAVFVSKTGRWLPTKSRKARLIKSAVFVQFLKPLAGTYSARQHTPVSPFEPPNNYSRGNISFQF
jgi:hypothetical protein